LAEKNFVVRHGITVSSNTLTVNSTHVGVNTGSASVTFHVAANDAILIPIGNTDQRPAGSHGMLRFNSETASFEGYANGEWGDIGGSSGGGYYKGDLGVAGDANNIVNLFRINANTLNTNTTIDASENAQVTGPLAIANGVSLVINGRVAIV
jgi:hypothetical protein